MRKEKSVLMNISLAKKRFGYSPNFFFFFPLITLGTVFDFIIALIIFQINFTSKQI